jgi:cytochrome c-type biogenesis protein CcmF
MPINIGMLLIWISFASCLGAVIYGTWYYFNRNPNMRLASRRFEMISLVACTLSAMLLMYYLLEVRAYYLYVYRFSCETFPLLYKVSAFWAGQEGSLFIWAWFTLVCVALVRMRADNRISEIVRIAGLSVAAFFILLLVIRSPFALIYGVDNQTWNLLSTNTDILKAPYSVIESYHAQGMNPLLRNPWMVIHPPVVFLGYATAVIPFGAAAGYLLTNDRQWMKIAIPWSRGAGLRGSS